MAVVHTILIQQSNWDGDGYSCTFRPHWEVVALDEDGFHISNMCGMWFPDAVGDRRRLQQAGYEAGAYAYWLCVRYPDARTRFRDDPYAF